MYGKAYYNRRPKRSDGTGFMTAKANNGKANPDLKIAIDTINRNNTVVMNEAPTGQYCTAGPTAMLLQQTCKLLNAIIG